MTRDFSFCGTHISTIGLSYAPELENTYVYRPAATNVHEETFEGHNGGYIYGAWKEPKEFILRCYFEEKRIDKGIMAKIHSLFRIGKTGKLIFDKRPWCYYFATVTNVDDRETSNYLNGIITITMKAAYPFARADFLYNERTDPFHDDIMNNSAAYDKQSMPPVTSFLSLPQNTVIIGNPGTERAAVKVTAAGDALEGIVIANNTTGQSMKIIGLSKAETTNVNGEVIIDSLNGKTILSKPNEKTMAAKYHDYGFLELESAFPAIRDLYIHYDAGYTVQVVNILNENLIGKYIFVQGEWRKINTQPDKHTLTVSKAMTESGTEKTTAMLMNEIQITAIGTADITKLSFEFKPTFA